MGGARPRWQVTRLCGANAPSRACAAALATKMGVSAPTQPVFAKTDRYVVYKVQGEQLTPREVRTPQLNSASVAMARLGPSFALHTELASRP